MSEKNYALKFLLIFIIIEACICCKETSGTRESISQEVVAKIKWFDGPSYRYFMNPYHDFTTFKISNDKKRFAHVMKSGVNECVVINMTEDKCYYSVNNLTFSSDSKHIAYKATDSKGLMRIVVDGKEKRTYNAVGDFVFSPDSQHIAYAAQKDEAWIMVHDEKEDAESYQHVTAPVFSPDSKHFAYIATDNEGLQFVVRDGQQEKSYDAIGIMPDEDNGEGSSVNSGAFACTMRDVNDKMEEKLIFSNDSKHLAYFAREGEEWFAVLDGKEGKRYRKVKMLQFSSDSKHLVHAACCNIENSLWWSMKRKANAMTTSRRLCSVPTVHILPTVRI